MRVALLCLVLLSAIAAGCEGPHPYVQEGDADSVQIRHGGAPEATWPTARQWCARYERQPMLVSAENDLATYNCVKR